MGTIFFRGFSIALCLGFFLASPEGSLAQSAKPRVLIVYSHDRLLPVNVRIDEGFRTAKSGEGEQRYELFTEHLDLARFPRGQQQEVFAAYLLGRYGTTPPDVIVAVGDHAFDFLAARREVLFPKVPFVFSAISGALIPKARAMENSAGFPISLRKGETLDAMLMMLPGLHEVVVIAGAAPTDRIWDSWAVSEQKRLEAKVRITYWPNLPLDEVVHRVAALPSDSAVLLLTYLREPNGASTTGPQVTERIAHASSVPLFVPYETCIGSGAVGGHASNFFEFGAATERIVSRLLAGETPAQIGIVDPPEPRHVFDARQLTRWNIARSTLPRGSEIWFEKKKAWQEYPRVALVAFVGFLVQSALIGGLILQKLRRRRMQHALDKSEDRFAKAFRASSDAISISRLADGTLLDVNEQWEKVVGYRRADVIGRSTLDLSLWDNPADRDELIAHVMNGPVRDIEAAFRDSDGEVVPVLLSAEAIEMDGVPSFVVIARDLRDRRRAEEATRDLVHASRLAAVGELTASLAHELNQPLTAIVSNAAAARRSFAHGQTDPAFFEELFQDVNTDARRAGDIIQGINRLVKKGEQSRRLLSINDIVEESLRLLRGNFIHNRVTPRVWLASNLPELFADPVQLQQVLINLLLNAVDAMRVSPPDDRIVTVQTTLDADSFVRVTVDDHGPGVPLDKVEKVFDHFYTTKQTGLGMGLSIVRSIAEAHGGNVVAMNTGVGARFALRLPAPAGLPSAQVA